VAALEDALTTAGMLDEPRQAKALANSALANLGVAVRGQGRIAEATRIHENALAGHRAVGSARGEMNALADLGDVALQLGDPPRAVERYHAALRLAWEYDDRRTIAWAIEGTGCAAAASGQAGAAARLLGAAARLQDQTGLVSWLPLDQVALESGKAAARAVLGEDAYTAAWTAGQAMPLDEAVAAALAVTIATAERPAVSLTPRELQIADPAAAGPGDDRPGDRGGPLPQPPHRRAPRRPPLRQVGGAHPARGDRSRPRRRAPPRYRRATHR
jgi:tetratricopeptide (TPR) repeat protein